MGSKDLSSAPQDPHSPSSNPPVSGNVGMMTETTASYAASLGRGNTVLPTKLVKLMIIKTPDFRSETRLDDNYEPQPFDVICTRHKESSAHPGNVRFRLCVEMRLGRYLAAPTRREKTKIVKEIIDAVRDSGGKFIKQQDTNPTDGSAADVARGDVARKQNEAEAKLAYFDIGNKRAADKISHALRFAVLTKGNNSRRRSWPPGTFFFNDPQSKSRSIQDPPSPLSSGLAQEKTECDGGKPFALDQDRKRQAIGFAYTDILNSDITFSRSLPPVVSFMNSTNRRQSWHGFAGDKSNNNLVATADFESGFSTPSDDESLSSREWNLSSLQHEHDNDDDDDDDLCSFGSLPSEARKLSIQEEEAIMEPLQIHGTETEADALDDDQSWDQALF